MIHLMTQIFFLILTFFGYATLYDLKRPKSVAAKI